MEPLGLLLQLDTGIFQSLSLDMASKRIVVTVASPSSNPAGEQSYSYIRLRVDQVSRPVLRPGKNFTVDGAEKVRSAFQVPGKGRDETTIVVTWLD